MEYDFKFDVAFTLMCISSNIWGGIAMKSRICREIITGRCFILPWASSIRQKKEHNITQPLQNVMFTESHNSCSRWWWLGKTVARHGAIQSQLQFAPNIQFQCWKQQPYCPKYFIFVKNTDMYHLTDSSYDKSCLCLFWFEVDPHFQPQK